jgi:hypothetical protein
MSDEKEDRIIVRPESPQWQGERKPLIPRGPPPRPQEEIDSLADRVAENHSLMEFFNSGMGSNDEEFVMARVGKNTGRNKTDRSDHQQQRRR